MLRGNYDRPPDHRSDRQAENTTLSAPLGQNHNKKQQNLPNSGFELKE